MGRYEIASQMTPLPNSGLRGSGSLNPRWVCPQCDLPTLAAMLVGKKLG